MKTETLQQSLDFVLGTMDAKNYIKGLEINPDKFVIYQIAATVTSYQDNIISILINFRERDNPDDFKEDAIVNIQGTNYSNFKILNIKQAQINP